MRTATNHSITVRLPGDLYRRTADLARRRNKSLNTILQEGVSKLLVDEEERELSDAFDLLAQSPEECDVEYAIYAQSEVILRDDE